MMLANVTFIAPIPNIQNDKPIAGNIAMTTQYMIFFTESLSCTCGDPEILNRFILFSVIDS